MAALTITSILGPHPGTVTANALDFVWTAFPNTTANTIQLTDKEILLVRNDNAGPQTITLTSQPDSFKRTGHITTYSLDATECLAFSFVGAAVGWKDTNGQVTITASAVDLKYAVLRFA